MISDYRIRIDHQRRLLMQWLSPPSLAIVGSYYGGNIGDMALGYSTQHHTRIHGVQSSGLQTASNLNRWPRAQSLILGGGAVGWGSVFEKIYRHYEPERVALVGIDFHEDVFTSKWVKDLKRTPYISVRFQRSKSRLQEVLGREDIHIHADLAFGLQGSRVPTVSRKQNLVGLNLVPFQVAWCGNRFVSKPSYPGGTKGLETRGDALAEAYAMRFRSLCEQQLSAGNKVVHIPFTPEDDRYAKSVFLGLPVQFATYQLNPVKVIEQIAQCSSWYPTRLHGLIFGLVAQTATYPFAYSYKCKWLIEDLGFPVYQQNTPEGLLDSNVDAFTLDHAMQLEEDRLSELQRDVSEALSAALTSNGSLIS